MKADPGKELLRPHRGKTPQLVTGECAPFTGRPSSRLEAEPHDQLSSEDSVSCACTPAPFHSPHSGCVPSAGTIPGAHPMTPTHVLTHLLRGLPALFLVVGSWREGGCVEPVQALKGKLQSS